MTNTPAASEFQAKLQRLDALLRDAERFPDPVAREHMREMVRAVLQLHAAGLGRVLDRLAEAGEPGAAILDDCARDEIVSGLLLLHGMHPLDLEARVGQALDAVRPALAGHGGSVTLLAVEDGVVRLRLEGNCHGCPSSAATMRQTIEEAILAKAPDVGAIEVEGLVESVPATDGDAARVALPVL
jgi:Fe-S cluster biogenesis protein NfuA